MSKRPLVPSFIQKLDDYLLRNKPTTWSARAHLVVWYCLLLAVGLAALCYGAFYEAKEDVLIEGWTFMVAVLASVGFIVWLIFLLRFNVFKRYGQWVAGDGLKTFGLYFISIGAMVAICFVPSAVQTWRAQQQYSTQELIKDINDINIAACKLNYAILPLQWKPEIVTVSSVDKQMPFSNEQAADTIESDIYINKTDTLYMGDINHYTVDSADFESKMRGTDSVVHIRDSMYIFYECPKYTFVDPNYYQDFTTYAYTSDSIYNSAAIYRKVLTNFKPGDTIGLHQHLWQLQTKYNSEAHWRSYDYNNEYEIKKDDTYDQIIFKTYRLYNVKYGLVNIYKKQDTWRIHQNDFLRVFYYSTVILVLLVFAFRHTTVKTFFVSILVAVLLAILTSMFGALHYDNTGEAVLYAILLYYIIFLAYGIGSSTPPSRSLFHGIALNLFFIMTPFVPIIIYAIVWESQDNSYDKSQVIKNYLPLAEISGLVLLLLLLEPVFRKCYRNWYARPEN